MTQSINNKKIWIETHNANLRLKMEVSTFVWAKRPRRNASTTIARQLPKMSCPQEMFSLQTKTSWPT